MKVKFAVIGCGHIGLRHAEMIRRNAQAELVALIEIDQSKHEELKSKHPGCMITDSLQNFFQSGITADIICIATPNGLHAMQAIECINNNLHVVIEKPMALKKSECEAVIKQAEIKNKKVFCVMQNRFSPPSQWLKSIVENGTLGKIFMVQVNCFWNRDERYYKTGNWHGTRELDGGTLFTQFSHFIDLMYWVFGDITDIKATFSDFNHKTLTDFEDSGFVNFRFMNGAMGSFNYSTSVWDRNLESSMTIIGENGTVKIGGQYMDKVEYCDIKDYVMPDLKPTNPPNDYGAYKGSAANHHYIIENAVNVLNQQSGITTTSFEGLKVVDIIERIYALKTGPKS